MDATARGAGVSKGGLLYHFNSKSALEAALVERLERLAQEDVDEIEKSAEGVVAAHLRSSQNTGSPLDVTILAVSRLAQNGNDTASASLRRVRELWEESLRAHTRDETALQMVLLVSDGLYFNAVLDLNALPARLSRGPRSTRSSTPWSPRPPDAAVVRDALADGAQRAVAADDQCGGAPQAR